MSLFDIILLVLLGGFTLFGLWFGFVHALGSLIGTFVGVYMASRYYEPLADWLIKNVGWSANFSKVLVFIVAFLIINRLVGLVFYFIDKILYIFTHLPYIHGLNRVLGLVFGFLEGMLVLGTIFYFIARFPVSANFMSALSSSQIAPLTINFASVLLPFIPDAIKILKSTINTII